MAQGTYAPSPHWTGFDSNGDPLSGGLVYTYLAGTTTAEATYTDVDLTSANANPVVLDSAGRGTIFLSPGASYKFILKTSAGVLVWSRDNISAVPASSANLDITGTAGSAITAGQVVYLSDGSGSLTAGSWYPASALNSYSSTIGPVGFAPAAIASLASGTIRRGGRITDLSGLTLGSTYYLSATTGATTATAPTNNRRKLGVADTTSSIVLQIDATVPEIDVSRCNGRLTLTTGLAVTTADVTAATTIYFTPYHGNRVAIFDGTWWTMRTFAELSVAVPATTSTLYDVFLYDNAGTLTLETVAWSNSGAGTGARFASGVYAALLPTQDGVFVSSTDGTVIAPTKRYIGSVMTTAVSGQTEDSRAKRLVFNGHPLARVDHDLRVLYDTTYAYTTATYRQANAVTTNQVELVNGLADRRVSVSVQTSVYNATIGTATMVHIGEDSTTTPATESIAPQFQIQTVSQSAVVSASLTKIPTIGWHQYVWLEFSVASGTTNWNTASSGTGTPHNGISGTWAH